MNETCPDCGAARSDGVPLIEEVIDEADRWNDTTFEIQAFECGAIYAVHRDAWLRRDTRGCLYRQLTEAKTHIAELEVAEHAKGADDAIPR